MIDLIYLNESKRIRKEYLENLAYIVKNEDVINLKKLGILLPSEFKYSILNPTSPWFINLFLYLVGTEFKSIIIPLTFGSADNTPQSKIVVLICAGLINKV